MASKTLDSTRGVKRISTDDGPGRLQQGNVEQSTKLQRSNNKSVVDQVLDMYKAELKKYRKEETEKDLAELRMIENV